MFNSINAVIVGGFATFIILGYIFPARKFPQAKWWKLRGTIFAMLYLVLASYAPFLWVSWLQGPLLWDASELMLAFQVAAGFLAIQFVAYWWHRALHHFDLLWRVFHQMHHSVERMDGWGALYHHPLDVIGFTFMGSFALTMIVGISPEAAAIAAILGAMLVFFTHCNVRTPRWIGWFIERPEAHGRHHERGHHAGNYAELVIFDQIFGTWDNPAKWDAASGFEDGASFKLREMLAFRNISGPVGSDQPAVLSHRTHETRV